ncbi:hypothetical protein H6P81_014568 [Aristolochia fimbriata]|uniref:Uncharacterized protein n=1 Tax=Aristolochia fimbriata TaxID=158543 RepID=A0AAV7E324_ARIFI|nr:hypothetical protein H6P81_014568 [Aristolochia fimbriata]
MVSDGTHTGSDDSSSQEDGSVVDFRGDPVDNSKTGGWLAAGLILGTELSERICVMGISMNLVTYLVGDMHLSASKSATIVTNFMGTLNLLALLSGFLADAKLGRYWTVAISATTTAMGVTLLTVATTLDSMRPPQCNEEQRKNHECIVAKGSQMAMLYAALYTIALGGGGIKANVSGFGSDQFDVKNPKEEKAMIFFFNRFYFCVSLGSLFAVTVLVYIQDNVGRGWGYGISAATMIIAMTVLLGGTTTYRFRKPQGSPITVIGKVLYMAWKQRHLPLPSHPTLLNGYHDAKVEHTEKFRWLDKAAVLLVPSSLEDNINVGNFIGQEHKTNVISTVTEVEEVKMVIRLLPIWSTCILFWTIYSQMGTFSVEQATFTNRNLGSFVFPSGSLSFFLFISILLFTSLNEKLLVPVARKFTHNVQGITSLQRVGIGLVFSIIAMVVAATIEKERRDKYVNGQGKLISVFWLVPQYFLVGAGEAFAYVGQLEFFIREAPEKMKSLSTGFFLSTLAMGFFLSSLLVSLANKASHGGWMKNNLNKGKLDYFYWTLALLGILNFIAFLVFSCRHEYKRQINVSKENETNHMSLKTEAEQELQIL